MLHTHGNASRNAKIALFAIPFQLWSAAISQDFTTQVGNSNPLNLGNLVAVGDPLDFGSGPGFKGGVAYGLGMETVYDSNLFLQEDDPEDEVSLNLSPWISYSTDPEGGAKASFALNYYPVANFYLNNSDLNAFDQSGDVKLKFLGAKTSLELYARLNEVTGTDRLTGEFVTGSLFNTGIQGSYQLAPRTSISGGFSSSVSEYGDSSLVGATIYTAELGGFWAATERFRFGPGLRYTFTESSNTGTRDAWALFMQAQYLAGQRIQIVGSLGFEYADSSREADNSTLRMTGNLSAYYAINELWSWRNLIQYVTVPSPTDTNYVVNNLLISTGLERLLLRANVGVGLDYNLSTYEGVGPVGTDLGNENNLNSYLAYRRKFFLERLNFESKLRYSVNEGQVDWDQVQIYAGVDVQF